MGLCAGLIFCAYSLMRLSEINSVETFPWLTGPTFNYELTNSICTTCHRKVEAKIVFQDNQVHMHKRCAQHGMEKVLISNDIEYYKRSHANPEGREQLPAKFNTPIRYGCPYDCGLCPDHEQHSCLSLVEITDACNLTCLHLLRGVRTASADASLAGSRSSSCSTAVVRNEREPDIVQISGGEPTIHPQFFEILDAAKRRPIKHLMINTNGVRIAQDPEFAARLKDYLPGFEVYLQFDSWSRGRCRSCAGPICGESGSRRSTGSTSIIFPPRWS